MGRRSKKRKSVPSPRIRKSWKQLLWENVKSFGIVIVAVLGIRAVVIEATVVPTSSMQNTILVGDHLFLNKIAYGPRIPFTSLRLPAIKHYQHGDVIAFVSPVDPNIVLVKRLIGLPGDTLRMHKKQLYVNGHPMEEPYVVHSDPQVYPDAAGVPTELRRRDNFGPLTVPQNSIFALGDNRDESFDSRFWGFAPMSNLVGEPMFIHWSYDAPTDVWTATDLTQRLRDDIDIAEHFFTRTRWSRMGKVIRHQWGSPKSNP
ncbi:MAG: signal peptidase I [Acidobacteriia bacterium]|nr:signal peptidase I [Terriglobia bacterium]